MKKNLLDLTKEDIKTCSNFVRDKYCDLGECYITHEDTCCFFCNPKVRVIELLLTNEKIICPACDLLT